MAVRVNQFYVSLLGKEIWLSTWGKTQRPVVLCWHGLTRQSMDFEPLAQALAEKYYVVSPDLLGRGKSVWSVNPVLDYSFPYYIELALALIECFGWSKVCWVGTSMGGLLGILFDNHPQGKGKITHMVLNDVGPTIELPVLQQLMFGGLQLPVAPNFRSLQELFQAAYQACGLLTDEQWHSFTQHSFRRRDDGLLTAHYDPRVINPFFQNTHYQALWQEFQQLTPKTLVLRGADSAILTADIMSEMQTLRPDFGYQTFAGLGHFPYLNQPEQIHPIIDFLAATG